MAKREAGSRHSPEPTDVVIVGGGAMGCAAAYELAKRGKKVRLFEQYVIGNDLGSSHGFSRIIRRAYFEHPDYVPLIDRSYELWRELERVSGESLLVTTGIVEMGSPGGVLIKGVLQSCGQHGIDHERWTARQIQTHYPQFNVPDWMEGIWQKDAGILAVERCLQVYRTLARQHGAILHEDEMVDAVLARPGGGVALETKKAAYRAERALICAGPWADDLLSDLSLPLTVARQPLGFYRPLERKAFELGRFPLFLAEIPGHIYYGFPFFGLNCFKIAHHHGGRVVNPDTVDRTFHPGDDELLRDFMKQYLPSANGALTFGKICLYTNTPDMDFILDKHPRHEQIIIAAGFSGHGFKFSPVVGEILADLAIEGKTRHPIDRFKIGRLLPAADTSMPKQIGSN